MFTAVTYWTVVVLLEKILHRKLFHTLRKRGPVPGPHSYTSDIVIKHFKQGFKKDSGKLSR